jgi:hypothetical protein
VRVPPIVRDVLRGSGRSLEPMMRSRMEGSFGRDFGSVRVHTDISAGLAAQAVTAKAFTVGNHIVFGKSRYSSGTREGQALVAHELVHVSQQPSGGVTSTDSLRLGEADGAHERQAARVEAAFAKGESAVGYEANSTGPSETGVIRRSLLGGILGGIGGAAAGAGLGFLAGGPIGAIAGGVAGGIAGAVIGDKATTKKRPLTQPEIDYAKDIFKDTVDYSKITITRDSMMSAGAPKTLGNTIHLRSDWGHFKGDGLELTQSGQETLIHEMGHVWQYQNGGLAYIPKSLWAQFKAAIGKGTRDAAYNWREQDKGGVPWEKWNPEQQASAIEEYNILLRKSKDGSATVDDLRDLATLLPYMKKVWNRQGAPSFSAPKPRGNPI